LGGDDRNRGIDQRIKVAGGARIPEGYIDHHIGIDRGCHPYSIVATHSPQGSSLPQPDLQILPLGRLGLSTFPNPFLKQTKPAFQTQSHENAK
jgi:hypothetical protein